MVFVCARPGILCGGYPKFSLREATDFSCRSVLSGMEDYRLDQRVDPKQHPAAVKRMTEPKRRSYRLVGGELPGRKIDGRL
jgi:hypothetical protein